MKVTITFNIYWKLKSVLNLKQLVFIIDNIAIDNIAYR